MDKIFEWKIAFRNLFRNKKRTAATISAIVTGFCGLGLLGGYILRTERYLKVNTIYTNQVGHFSIYAPKGVDFFYINPKKYQLKPEQLEKINGVLHEPEFEKKIEFSGQYLTGMGLISNGKNSLPFIAVGVDPAVSGRIYHHPLIQKWTKELAMEEQGLDLEKAVKDHSESISITKSLGELLGLHPPFDAEELSKREVQLAGRTVYNDLNAVNALVSLSHTTGLSLAEDTGLFAPIGLLKELYGVEGASHLAVYLNAGVSLSPIMKELNQRFHELGIAAEIIPFNDERVGQFYVGTMAFLYIMAFFFVFLICSAVAISIVNAMTMGILERSREIGTMRSLGLSEKFIINIFVKEAILMTLWGGVIGAVLTNAIAFVVTSLKLRFSPPGIAGTMQFVLTPDLWICLTIGVLMLFVSGMTSYYVVKNKTRSKIINLLTDANR